MDASGRPYAAGVHQGDWSKAWKEWARGRKRGKMAQFIIEKLEEGKQARWLDISRGKFELSEWHAIADEWYRAKQNRNSDESDAPCMLRKGLPRAFPGLIEVKMESMKEGTQYRSRVFQCTAQLMQEVAHHLPSRAGANFSQFPQSNGQNQYVPTGNGQLYAPTNRQQQYLDTSGQVAGGGFLVNGFNGTVPNGNASPCYNTEDLSLLDESSESWFDLDVLDGSAGASPYLDQQLEGSPYPVSSPYNNSSPYSAGRVSPYPVSVTQPESTPGVEWSSPKTSVYRSPLGVSPGHNYSPGPAPTSWMPASGPTDGLSHSMSQGFTPAMSQGCSPAISQGFTSAVSQSVHHQELLQVQAIPSKSPIEGGNQLALLLNREMPAGKKVLMFTSTTKPEYTTSVECMEVNPMALMAIIPKHAIPEAVVLQVLCNAQLIATTEFMYYADAAYNSEMFYQFLCQNLPRYYHQSDNGFGGAGLPDGNSAMESVYGSGYGNNVPTSMYGILLGACRMGLEPLVYATLTLSAMSNISLEQLEKAREAAVQFGHHSLGDMFRGLIEAKQVVPRGGEAPNGVYCSRVADLHRGEGTPEEEAVKVLRLLTAEITANSVTVKVEGDQEVPKNVPTQPCKDGDVPLSGDKSECVKLEDSGHCSVAAPTLEVKTSTSPHKLPRQEKSIRDSDGLEEQADHVPPMCAEITATREEVLGRRGNIARQGKPRNTGGQSKTLVAAASDADSAVSMSFDDDSTSEVSHIQGSIPTPLAGPVLEADKVPGVTVTFDLETSLSLVESLHYEHAYVVSEDFPSEDKKLRCGDRITAIGDREVSGMNSDEFDRLLRSEAGKGTTTAFKVLPQLRTQVERSRALSPPTSLSLGSLAGEDMQEIKRLNQKQAESTITTKVANLLTMKSSRSKRVVTIPRTPEGFGFKVLGGNAVGLFVSESLRKDLEPGDQILEINGNPTRGMTHYEATYLLRQTTDNLTMTLTDNYSRYTALKDQVECDSFYLKSSITYTPDDPKEMKLVPGSLLHVVNTFLYRDHWLAWSVDQTGLESDLRKIRVPARTTPMSSEYERVELRVVPHPRPLVLLGASDKAVIKELDALEDFTECTRLRDIDKMCTPGGSQTAVTSINQLSDLAAIRHFSPLVIHGVLRPQTHLEASLKKMYSDYIIATVEADSVSSLAAAIKEKVKVLQQQPVWLPWLPMK